MKIDLDTADIYFSTRLDCIDWDELSEDEKQRAITTAYNKIKTLPFIGEKLSPNQEEIFPRFYKGQKIELPKDVIFGVFEEAYSLIKKYLNEENLPEGVSSISLGSASVSFNNSKCGSNNLSSESLKFLDAWLKKGFDIESGKFREVY